MIIKKNYSKGIILFVFVLGFLTRLTAQEGKESFRPDVKFGGRIHYDFEFLEQKAVDATTENYSLNGQEFRALFISATGAVAKNIKCKAELDFSGGKIAFRDIYIKYINVPVLGGNFIVGNQAEPTGLDMLTGSNHIPFNERTPITATQNARWNSGLGYENYNLWQDKLGLQATYCFNGKATEGFTDNNLENGAHFVTRVFSKVYENKDKNQLLHLGIHYENRQYTKTPADYTLKFKPENHMGYQITVNFDDLIKQQDYGFEIATQRNQICFQAEYENAGYKTLHNDYNIKGCYGLVSYFITGEKRVYKEGVFGRIIPKNSLSFSEKKFGAVELLARYSVFDYRNVVVSGNNDQVKSATLGLNWYFNSNARLMYNFILSDFNTTGNNPKLMAHLIRAQVDF